jgi:hypothetical protein
MLKELMELLFDTDASLAGGSDAADEPEEDIEQDEVDEEEDPTAGDDDESSDEDESSDDDAPRTFTQAEVNVIVSDRLKQERKKFKHLEKLLAQLSSAKDPQAAIEEINSSLKKYKREATQLKVGGRLGLPVAVSLRLTGETEEEMEEDAKELLEVWGKPTPKKSKRTPPPTDSVAGVNTKVKGAVGTGLTSVQKEAARKMGLTEKEYAESMSKLHGRT